VPLSLSDEQEAKSKGKAKMERNFFIVLVLWMLMRSFLDIFD